MLLWIQQLHKHSRQQIHHLIILLLSGLSLYRKHIFFSTVPLGFIFERSLGNHHFNDHGVSVPFVYLIVLQSVQLAGYLGEMRQGRKDRPMHLK